MGSPYSFASVFAKATTDKKAMEHKLAMVILWRGRRTKLRQWPLSDEQWERLQTYLSHVEGGEQRLQIYRKVQETGQVPVCIDAEQWVSQWNEDLQQAGI